MQTHSSSSKFSWHLERIGIVPSVAGKSYWSEQRALAAPLVASKATISIYQSSSHNSQRHALMGMTHRIYLMLKPRDLACFCVQSLTYHRKSLEVRTV